MRNFFIGAALLLLSLDAADAAKSTGSDDVLDAGLDDARAAGSPAVTAVPVVPPVTTVRVVAPPTAPAPERTLSANPLWAIPLTQLSATRTADLFTVAPAAARRGRGRVRDRQGANGSQEGT